MKYIGMFQYAKSDKFMNGKNRFTKDKLIADCLQTSQKEGPVLKERENDVDNLRIRKLTPNECFRLQGFDDESFKKAEKVCSNNQLYKQAGNSIVVDVLEEIFCMMLDENGEIYV